MTDFNTLMENRLYNELTADVLREEAKRCKELGDEQGILILMCEADYLDELEQGEELPKVD